MGFGYTVLGLVYNNKHLILTGSTQYLKRLRVKTGRTLQFTYIAQISLSIGRTGLRNGLALQSRLSCTASLVAGTRSVGHSSAGSNLASSNCFQSIKFKVYKLLHHHIVYLKNISIQLELVCYNI